MLALEDDLCEVLDCDDDLCEVGIDLQTREWLDNETREFIENDLEEAAPDYYQWLADICGPDDLFDVYAERRAWWNEQVRSFRSKLLRQHRYEEMVADSGGWTSNDGWHEDFELESRKHEQRMASGGGLQKTLLDSRIHDTQTASNCRWPEDFELESRRHQALLGHALDEAFYRLGSTFIDDSTLPL